MLISYNWLKEFLPDLDTDPVKVAELLTLHAFETDVSHTIAVDKSVVVAKIVKLEPHPGADRLRLATVDTGSETVTVVCGAPNISEGDVVPFSPPGTKLIDPEGNTFTLSKAKIRGVESPGMLNSPRELGLGDWHGGIYLLPQETPLGSKLSEHIPADTVLDVDLTPNRAHDCYSHRGVARELAGLLRLDVKELTIAEHTSEPLSGWELAIEDSADTPAYYGTLLEDCEIGPAPLWMQAKLWSIGARPINNVVDVTNYVMFELGNPTHTFDADTLTHKKIGVRRARDGELLATLDDTKHQLSSENLLITDGDEPIALAGVMGGKETEVTDTTSKLFLEVANFAPFTIFKSTQAVRAITEGSARWVKSVPVPLAAEASSRTISLLEELASAKVVGSVNQVPEEQASQVVYFDPRGVQELAGVPFANETIKTSLERARCEVATDESQWEVTVPSDRLDLTGPHDLVEEVVRVTGLKEITPRVPESEVGELSSDIQWREQIRRFFIDKGFTETMNYSFEDAMALSIAESEVDETTAVEVSNPVSPDQKYLRQSLVPLLLQHVLHNKGDLTRRSGATEDALFEIGTAFKTGKGGRVEGIVEEEHIAAVLVGPRARVEYIDELLHELRELLSVTGIDDVVDLKVLPAHARLSSKLGLPVAYFSLPLAQLIEKASNEPAYVPTLTVDQAAQYEKISEYPPVLRDVSFLVGADVTVEQVQDVLDRAGGELLVDVDLFDEYIPEPSASAKATADEAEPRKSLAFHLTYQAMDRTLSDDEVSEAHNAVLQTLKDELAAELRE